LPKDLDGLLAPAPSDEIERRFLARFRTLAVE